MRPSFFHHLHPPTIPAQQSRWRYTLGAGGTAIFLVLVLIITGALEMFYYIPTPGEAALSIQTISYLVPLGGLVRNIHFWAAQLLLIVTTVHLVRIIFTGAYAPPRRFNYLLGLALFVLAILLDFTGYILRWDMGIQWALVVGTNLVKTIPFLGESLYAILIGGPQPGGATLIRFYAWHIFGLTLLTVVLIGWHAFRVRRDGGIAIPPPSSRTDNNRISRNELVHREVLAMLFTTSALILLSAFLPAPIAPPIADSISQSAPIHLSASQSVPPSAAPSTPATPIPLRLSASQSAAPSAAQSVAAPWFFLWVQYLLKWGDPFIMGVVVPLSVLAVLALIPYVLPKPAGRELGGWFPHSNRLAQIVLAIIAALVIILTLLALLPGGQA